MIQIQTLHKKYGNVRALDSVDLTWNQGDVIALIGPNGSGKTTLIKCILGLVFPSAGDIHFMGRSILNSYEYRKDIGYMSQISRFPDQLRVGEMLDILTDVRNVKDSDRDMELYEEFKIEQIRDKTMKSLSGGTRQKVNSALAFMFSPKVLIMDEPTAGLDPVAVEILKGKIHRTDKSVRLMIITSHILSDLEDFATRINYLQDGKVRIDYSFAELREKSGESRLSKAIAHILNPS